MKIELIAIPVNRCYIAEVLHHGSGNGITMLELAALFNCTEREIRERIHRERVNGAVILASENGYYLPSADPETALHEIRAFEHRMHAKARNTLEATKSATAARIRLADELNDQGSGAGAWYGSRP